GELRNANGDLGVWVRMVRGESEYKTVKHQYNQYQLGYDEKLSTDPSWTVGAALSYTDGESSYAKGNGENTHKGLAIYGSKLNEDGSFIDLIAKYSRLDNDFKAADAMGDGEYDANAYSFSAEYGKRIQKGNGLWIEPQVELTYGKVAAVDYVTSKGVNVAQDGMESLIGRIGFSLGKDIKDGNVYARASYLYDFEGETETVLNGKECLKEDLGGGWWEVGVGANINLSKATYIYADIEKTFGGEVDTNWQWNLGVRYSF
ncbi:MAG: autotransporter outer membrane beta-barrel domain-containing protein, partial [Phascolarctobacterium sp.]|nr:autotransporter outer membrane beta-barrel domain-containing protein [Phascolarctobacterium sp.]